MRQEIRERLTRAGMPGGYEPMREKLLTGDTYEKYRNRCKFAAIEPKSFNEWLQYDLATSRRGHHTHLDDVQRFAAMSIQAG